MTTEQTSHANFYYNVLLSVITETSKSTMASEWRNTTSHMEFAIIQSKFIQ